MTAQPDLFGEYDEQVARAEADRQPRTCPRCGVTEPNGYLFSINHGEPGPGPCMAQYLIRNHLIFAAQLGPDDFLEAQKARARAHRLDVDAIIAEAAR